jgi:iron complex transport system substrate-binding protein
MDRLTGGRPCDGRSICSRRGLLGGALAVAAIGKRHSSGGAAELARTRVVATARGHVEIPAQPERIVIPDQNDLGALLALGHVPVGSGGADPGVGYDRFAPFYDETEYAGVLDGIAIVGAGYEPNLETVASLAPDLVVAPAWYEPRLLDRLAEIAPTFVYPRAGVNVDVTWDLMLREIGYVLAAEERAEVLIAAVEAKASRGASLLRERIETGATVALINIGDGQLRLYGLDSSNAGHVLYNDLALTPAPLVREGWAADISLELLPEIGADHLFVRPWSTDDVAYLDVLVDDPLWRTIPAVEQGRVYVNQHFFVMANNVVGRSLLLDYVVEAITDVPIPAA